jgi:hypothetical protein
MTQTPQLSDPVPGFCRDCLAPARSEAKRCHACGSPRLIRHPEIDELTLAHMDCDAFYASVEKRDNPELARQAGDRRRRQARRRLDLLLHRAHQRRALGDADVQGARRLPGRGRHQAGHGEICPRRQGSPAK